MLLKGRTNRKQSGLFCMYCIWHWIEVIVNGFSNWKYSGGLGHCNFREKGVSQDSFHFAGTFYHVYGVIQTRCSKGYGECCPFCHFFQLKDGLRKLTGNRKAF